MTKRMRALAGAFLFLAALWCGMLAFFGAFGARVVLETSPSRHAAGPFTVMTGLVSVRPYPS